MSACRDGAAEGTDASAAGPTGATTVTVASSGAGGAIGGGGAGGAGGEGMRGGGAPPGEDSELCATLGLGSMALEAGPTASQAVLLPSLELTLPSDEGWVSFEVSSTHVDVTLFAQHAATVALLTASEVTLDTGHPVACGSAPCLRADHHTHDAATFLVRATASGASKPRLRVLTK
jgi:hypothetical protein